MHARESTMWLAIHGPCISSHAIPCLPWLFSRHYAFMAVSPRVQIPLILILSLRSSILAPIPLHACVISFALLGIVSISQHHSTIQSCVGSLNKDLPPWYFIHPIWLGHTNWVKPLRRIYLMKGSVAWPIVTEKKEFYMGDSTLQAVLRHMPRLPQNLLHLHRPPANEASSPEEDAESCLHIFQCRRDTNANDTFPPGSIDRSFFHAHYMSACFPTKRPILPLRILLPYHCLYASPPCQPFMQYVKLRLRTRYSGRACARRI